MTIKIKRYEYPPRGFKGDYYNIDITPSRHVVRPFLRPCVDDTAIATYIKEKMISSDQLSSWFVWKLHSYPNRPDIEIVEN